MNLKSNLKDIIKDNSVFFVKFRQGYCYYRILVPEAVINRGRDTQEMSDNRSAYPATWYTFPVPIEDVGDATLEAEAEDKAIYFMRYIRKARDNGTFLPLTHNGALYE